jgi:uncharacterized CHY-type Zn-finger protein
MLGSSDRAKTLSSSDWYGQYVECELCEDVRLCTEYCGLVTCPECQERFLPSSGRL